MNTAKHAYLIIAHSNEYILERLLKMLDNGQNDIFLHIDKKSTKLKPEKIKTYVAKSRLFFVKPMSVFWGHSSQVDCEMKLLKACVKQENYDYIHLISGVDLPIKAQDYIHNFFANNPNKQFLQIGDASNHLYRLNKFHFFIEREERKGFLKLIDNINELLTYRLKINRLKKYGDLQIVKTANWFSITGECADYIVSKSNFIKRFTRYTVCADEMFLGTVIWNSPFKDQIYNPNPSWDGHMRYIDRIRNVGSSPHTFTIEDKDSLDNSEMLFARKFDENTDKEIIDYIYNKYKN